MRVRKSLEYEGLQCVVTVDAELVQATGELYKVHLAWLRRLWLRGRGGTAHTSGQGRGGGTPVAARVARTLTSSRNKNW